MGHGPPRGAPPHPGKILKVASVGAKCLRKHFKASFNRLMQPETQPALAEVILWVAVLMDADALNLRDRREPLQQFSCEQKC